MALKSGYYGVKKNILDELKQLDGAKITKSFGSGLDYDPTTGELGLKFATLVPINAGENGITLNVGAGLATSVIETVPWLSLGKIIKKVNVSSESEISVDAGSFATVSYTIPSGYSVIHSEFKVTGAGSSAHSFLSAASGPGSFIVGNKDSAAHSWTYEYTLLLINNSFIENYASRSIEEPEQETKTTKKSTKKTE